MTALTFLVLSFAAYRAARAIAIDSISQPLRKWAEYRSSRVGHYFDNLIHCGFCCSWWTAGITYLVWVLVTPSSHTYVMVHFINWWAVAGLANMLIAIDSFLLREAPPH